jgi:hypothetical protein
LTTPHAVPQGFMLLKQAAVEYKWDLQYGNIALMWRGGCIIRSVFLGNIKEAFDKNPALPNLMLDPWFTNKLRECSAGWRRVVALGALSGVPTPCFSSALSFYDGYRSISPAVPCLFPAHRLWLQVSQDLRQSHPGPARLLRRAHVRAHRQAPPPDVPHQLDRPRRHYRFLVLQRVINRNQSCASRYVRAFSAFVFASVNLQLPKASKSRGRIAVQQSRNCTNEFDNLLKDDDKEEIYKIGNQTYKKKLCTNMCKGMLK